MMILKILNLKKTPIQNQHEPLEDSIYGGTCVCRQSVLLEKINFDAPSDYVLIHNQRLQIHKFDFAHLYSSNAN